MNLCQSHYIEKRENDSHFSLNGEWEFCWEDQPQDNIEKLSFGYKTQLPSDVYFSLYNAGILPHPYHGTNSKEYNWVDDKIWYFKKVFDLDKKSFSGNAYLCFDGISYYSKIWINGKHIGYHEGMLGGPIVDIFEHLNLSGENEIIVEVIPAVTNNKESFYSQERIDGSASQIIPWDTIRSYATPDYVLVGIWNDIRIEFLNKIHLSRPYMKTSRIDKELACLNFEVEISSPDINELQKPFGDLDIPDLSCWTTGDGITGIKKDEKVSVEITIKEKDTLKTVYSSCDEINLTDYQKQSIDIRIQECQFFRKNIIIPDPKLWYPTGLGDPYLYEVNISLKQNELVIDKLGFDYGIRLFETGYTPGEKFKSRIEKFKFSINGKDFFLKGMNWAPIDQQYNFKYDEYKWTLMLAKNAGIQLIRIWNGGGIYEKDDFYKICDELGIMVWQDHCIANTFNTVNYPKNILESQISMNIYRIRNHPSLVIHCGGNEFNPYKSNTAASMFTTINTINALDDEKTVYLTTPDGGSSHIYRDFEPIWYRHCYKHLSFVGESGIHSFPNFKSFSEVIGDKETTTVLTPLDSDEFIKDFPEIVSHFVEYEPRRTVRLLSRISQVTDLKSADLKEYCEASHVQAYEFYQIMIQSMLENYPVCGGIMPWVFRRPYTSVAIQLVDGAGRPILPYYAVKNSYLPVNAFLQLEWNLLYPGESIPLVVNISDSVQSDLFGAMVTVTIINSNMEIVFEEGKCVEPNKKQYDFGFFKLDDSFTNTCFLINVRLEKDGSIISDNTYFPRCLEEFKDDKILEKHRNTPQVCMRREHGPFIKDTFKAAPKGHLLSNVKYIGKNNMGYSVFKLFIQNTTETPVYPVTFDCQGDIRFFADNNFFLLKGNEQKTITITTDSDISSVDVTLSAWNCDPTCCHC